MGIEGKTWQKTDDDKWEWILGNGYGDDVGTVRSSSTIQGAANHPSIRPNYWYTNMSPEVDPDEVYLNEQRAKMATDGKVPLPVMNYSEEDGLTIATLTADINSYIDQYVAQVATGDLTLDDSWDEYVGTLESMGAGQLMDIYQAAYDAGISAE